MTQRASRRRRPPRLVEGECRIPPTRRPNGAPLGTRRGPASAPTCPPRARQRLCVQVRDRHVATHVSTPPAADYCLDCWECGEAATNQVDCRPAVHELEYGAIERILHG